MTTNTAGTKKPAAKHPNTILVGQTFRKVALESGMRPFAVVEANVDDDTASGWLFPDPKLDGNDPLLRALGIQAEDRRRPCYITVRTHLVK